LEIPFERTINLPVNSCCAVTTAVSCRCGTMIRSLSRTEMSTYVLCKGESRSESASRFAIFSAIETRSTCQQGEQVPETQGLQVVPHVMSRLKNEEDCLVCRGQCSSLLSSGPSSTTPISPTKVSSLNAIDLPKGLLDPCLVRISRARHHDIIYPATMTDILESPLVFILVVDSLRP
jgi:hypothetical protein